MLTAVKIAGDQKNSPTVIDLAEHCPTCKDVQESFSKLKKLCLCSKKISIFCFLKNRENQTSAYFCVFEVFGIYQAIFCVYV